MYQATKTGNAVPCQNKKYDDEKYDEGGKEDYRNI